ncbi:MarR family transcriptional regulator, partial [Streptomyces tanashiensis]
MPEGDDSRERPRRPTATNRTAARVNTAALLDRLRTAGPQSLSELTQHTGLSTATVNRLVDRLIDDGLVLEAGRTVPTGGRPTWCRWWPSSWAGRRDSRWLVNAP